MASAVKTKILPFYKDTGYGYRICGVFSLDAFRSALSYKPCSDDLFIVTYPRSGTTWVQNIVGCIYREGKPYKSALEFLTCTPFLEMTGQQGVESMPRPGAIKMHLPFHLAPWSTDAKYIFIARNPKDCVVSLFHLTKNIPVYNFKNGEFDDFFELFIDGKTDFGDYFDTLLSWYEHRSDPNVLFLTYEGLKKDIRGNVIKIAEFLGEKYKVMLEEDDKILEDVIAHTSFEFMKSWLNSQIAELGLLPPDFVENHPDLPPGLKAILKARSFDSNPDTMTYVRKGIIGDYKNYLSSEQNRRLEDKFKERTKGTDIPELWRDIM